MQHLKNIRAAVTGLDPDHARDLAIAAGKWIEDVDRPRVAMHDVAEKALLEALPLEAVACTAGYKTPAQRRAWATGALLAAIMDISAAYDRRAQAVRFGQLEEALAEAKASARAAWKAGGMTVPFRDPKRSYRGAAPAWADNDNRQNKKNAA